MPWNSNMQSRFDELRRAELNETLTANEQAELAALVDVLYEDEGRALTPAVAQMQAEQQLLQSQIEAGQGENAELARLLNQQQQLVTDFKSWYKQWAIARTKTSNPTELWNPSAS